jgi:hypothetical protein
VSVLTICHPCIQYTSTTAITIWQNLQDPNGDLYEEYIKLYADPKVSPLIYRDEHTGKKVFFTTANPTSDLVKKIEAAGDIVVVVMWALRKNFDKGEFGFFSPCIDAATSFKFTTSISATKPCNQFHTTNAPIGSSGTAITVSPSYQLSYASLPFLAPGVLGGLTLRKQFEKALAMNAAGALDYLMIGTFNEHIAQPQKNPYEANSAAISMGMEGDLSASELWVDMYGLTSRDLEPTKEDGGAMWAVFQSCMRLFNGGVAKCTNSSELCCNLEPPKLRWTAVYSLSHQARLTKAVEDNLLTTLANERDALVKGGWEELCSPLGGSTVFCKGNNPPTASWEQGPFLLHSQPLQPPQDSSPVHRCITPKGHHFVTTTVDCRGGIGKLESVLGHTALQRDTDTPRSLRLCQALPCPTSGCVFYHRLDAQCAAADKQLEYMGFAH